MPFSDYDRRWIARSPRVAASAPPPGPFDRATALKTFERLVKAQFYSIDWSKANLPPRLTQEEAVFWLRAMTLLRAIQAQLPRETETAGFRAQYAVLRMRSREILSGLDVSAIPPRTEIARWLATAQGNTWGGGSDRPLAVPLATVLGAQAALELILDENNDALVVADAGSPDDLVSAASRETPLGWMTDPTTVLRPGIAAQHRNALHWSLAAGFADLVAPYLDDREFGCAQRLVRAAVQRALRRPPFAGTPAPGRSRFPIAYYLAAGFHLTDEVEAIDAALPDHSSRSRPYLQTILYGLRTPDVIVTALRRHEVELPTPDDVRAFLATTGEDGLEYAHQQMLKHADEATAKGFVDAVSALESSRLSDVMLRMTGIPPLYVDAREWLEEHFDAALPALAAERRRPTAAGQTATEILMRFERRGHSGATAVATVGEP